ncbi:MAG: hypothetical protein WA450_00980 [Candidatus Acidiferrales bacterium]
MTVNGVPGVRVIGVGEAVTPAGSPDTWTETSDAKPFMALAFNEVVADDPVAIETEPGDADKEKSGSGGGGC